MTLRSRFLFLTCLLALLLLSTACAAPVAEASASVDPRPAAAERSAPVVSTPSPTPVPYRQEGALDNVLLDEKDLYAAATAYRFAEGESIELTVSASNGNGNPATIWFLFAELNGWDVRSLAQSTVVVSLAPGETKQETIRFDTSTGAARFLSLSSLSNVVLAVEGYVDSSNYEYTMRESTIALQDAPAGREQRYYEKEHVLYASDPLTMAYLGNTEDGTAVFYAGVNEPAENAKCTLYPLENGLYDAEKYLVPTSFDLDKAGRRLVLFAPAAGSALPNAFCAVFSGVSLAPARLTFDSDTPFAKSDMPVLAENAYVRLCYDAPSHRILAENLTKDTTLLLELGKTFALDGREIKANPQSILCFPQAASIFRISGRGVDEKNVERNITVTADARTLSAEWSILSYADGMQAPLPLDTIALDCVLPD